MHDTKSIDQGQERKLSYKTPETKKFNPVDIVRSGGYSSSLYYVSLYYVSLYYSY